MIFFPERLARVGEYNENGRIKGWSKGSFYLTIKNDGQQSAGWVNVYVKSNSFAIYPSPFRIENLHSISSDLAIFQIWYNKCSEGASDKECNKDLVPTGIQYLNISINCQYCEKEINGLIRICIYNKTEDECKELMS